MWQNEQFITDNRGGIFRTRSKQQLNALSKKKVIKSDELVVLNNKKRINPVEDHFHPDHEGQVKPIMEAGELVGIVYECSCGEVAKIMFEFNEKVNRAAG